MIFALAIGRLTAIPRSPGPGALASFHSFHAAWDAGLIVFGCHLLLLGFLVFRSGDYPRLLGILTAASGLGYLVDSTVKLLAPSCPLAVSTVTFIGEVLLMGWLIGKGIQGARRARPPDA